MASKKQSAKLEVSATDQHSAVNATAKAEAKAEEVSAVSTMQALAAWEKETALTPDQRKAVEDGTSKMVNAIFAVADSRYIIGQELRKLQSALGALFSSYMDESKVLASLNISKQVARLYMEQSKVIENATIVRNKIARRCLMTFASRALTVPRYAVKAKDGSVTHTSDATPADNKERDGFMLSPFLVEAIGKRPEPKPTADEATCEVWARNVLLIADQLRGKVNRTPQMAVGIDLKSIRESSKRFFSKYSELDCKRLVFAVIREYGAKFAADSTEYLIAELEQVVASRDWEKKPAEQMRPVNPSEYDTESKAKVSKQVADLHAKTAPVRQVARA